MRLREALGRKAASLTYLLQEKRGVKALLRYIQETGRLQHTLGNVWNPNDEDDEYPTDPTQILPTSPRSQTPQSSPPSSQETRAGNGHGDSRVLGRESTGSCRKADEWHTQSRTLRCVGQGLTRPGGGVNAVSGCSDRPES